MSIGTTSPFRPTGTVSLNVGTTSASIELAGGGGSAVVTNPTASLAYVRFGGDPSVPASSADLPALPTSRVVLSVNALISYAAAMLASGSGSVLYTRGNGSAL
jgi:hypothetical protein